MFVLGLLTCIALRAFSAQAKVVPSFEECRKFFCNDKEPEGMDQNAKKICQKLENSFYYATLYSVSHRIPLYSAYILDPKCSDTTGRKDIWHIEPQISDPSSSTDHMVHEKGSDINTIKQNQAVSSDYTDTGYDRGHLNPNSFQYGEGRTGTFALTNAAPMDAHFNRVPWRNWESTLRTFLLSKLASDGKNASAYIVTGTVPSANIRIPQRENLADSNRVRVPSHIWTAVSYIYKNDSSKSFSFGYIGNNTGISLMNVSNLEKNLSELYSELSKIKHLVRIFDRFCNNDENHEDEVKLAFKKLMNPSRKDDVSPGVQEKKHNTVKSVINYSINSGQFILIALLTICIVSKCLCNKNQNQRRDVPERGLNDQPCTTNDNNWESTPRRFKLSKLATDGGSATAYIVTGTVPSANIRIRQRENPVDSNRVTVPSHVCMAVCHGFVTDDCSPLLSSSGAKNVKYCRNEIHICHC